MENSQYIHLIPLSTRGTGRGESSVRERPEPQLLLGDLPEPGEAVGLDNQDKDDQAAEDHQLEVGHQSMRDLDVEGMGGPAGGDVEHDRKQGDERGAEERAEDRADAADDDHEQDAER